jgi:hypothetical protein
MAKDYASAGFVGVDSAFAQDRLLAVAQEYSIR